MPNRKDNSMNNKQLIERTYQYRLEVINIIGEAIKRNISNDEIYMEMQILLDKVINAGNRIFKDENRGCYNER